MHDFRQQASRDNQGVHVKKGYDSLYDHSLSEYDKSLHDQERQQRSHAQISHIDKQMDEGSSHDQPLSGQQRIAYSRDHQSSQQAENDTSSESVDLSDYQPVRDGKKRN